MSYYSLLPGTNQLILKNGSQGQALFRKHGYNINRNPNHYDYYRALQGERREGFFDDLASILGGVAKVWSASSSANGGSRGQALSLSSATTRDSISGIGNSSPFQIGGIPASSDIGSYFGRSQGSGVPNNAARGAAYLELVNHFRNESIRHNYMDGFQQFNYYQVVPQAYSVGVQFQSDDQSGDRTIQPMAKDSSGNGNDQGGGFDFGDVFQDLRKPLTIICVVILALIIWSKIR